MTILLPVAPSPVRFLLSRMGLKIGSKSKDIARALQNIPLTGHRHLSFSMRRLLAGLCVREITGQNRIITENDINILENRALRIIAGKPGTINNCRHLANKRFNLMNADNILYHHQLEKCILDKMPLFAPNKSLCAQLSGQLILQLIQPSDTAITSIQRQDWINCAERLYRQCSSIS